MGFPFVLCRVKLVLRRFLQTSCVMSTVSVSAGHYKSVIDCPSVTCVRKTGQRSEMDSTSSGGPLPIRCSSAISTAITSSRFAQANAFSNSDMSASGNCPCSSARRVFSVFGGRMPSCFQRNSPKPDCRAQVICFHRRWKSDQRFLDPFHCRINGSWNLFTSGTFSLPRHHEELAWPKKESNSLQSELYQQSLVSLDG